MTYTEPLILVFVLISSATIGILGLLFISWPPFDWLAALPLEARYAGRLLPQAPAQAIVVLLSSVRTPRPDRPYAIPDRETYERSAYAAWLYQHWKSLPVLLCGGPQEQGGQPVSVVTRALLVREGVPESRIWTEERSRSTHENAIYGTAVLGGQGITTIALVVDAQSMLRAAAFFRKEGMIVIPAASGYREWGSLKEELIPSWKTIQRNEITLHETVGLVWYRLRGWI